MLRRLMLPAVSLLLLLACSPTEAWYKQVAGPRYYSVGRASGLLAGIRRSPSTKRAEPAPADGESAGSSALNFILRTMVSAPQRNYGTALGAVTFMYDPNELCCSCVFTLRCSPTSPSVSKTSNPTLRAASSCRTSGVCSAARPTSSSPWTPLTARRTELDRARRTSRSSFQLQAGVKLFLKLSCWF